MTFRTLGLLAGIALLTLASVAHADRYRVDIIVYQDHTGSGGERPVPARAPDLANVIELADSARLRAARITLLPDEAFGLQQEWKRLANSKRHDPLLRLAWLQTDPPPKDGPGLRLRSGTPMAVPGADGLSSFEIYPVDGSVRLLMGRFLHLEANLAYTTRRQVGDIASFRMDERRRMRRNEIHHLDSPRLGLLARVVKAETTD